MPRSFADVLRAHLAAKKLSQGDFSALAGLNKGFLHGLLVGAKLPPMDRVGKMSEVLGLSPTEREEFELLAGLEHSPEPVARFVSQVLDERTAKAAPLMVPKK